jgi:hypothetical protein
MHNVGKTCIRGKGSPIFFGNVTLQSPHNADGHGAVGKIAFSARCDHALCPGPSMPQDDTPFLALVEWFPLALHGVCWTPCDPSALRWAFKSLIKDCEHIAVPMLVQHPADKEPREGAGGQALGKSKGFPYFPRRQPVLVLVEQGDNAARRCSTALPAVRR